MEFLKMIASWHCIAVLGPGNAAPFGIPALVGLVGVLLFLAVIFSAVRTFP